MTKEVLITIAGLQFEVDANEAIEMISAGEYYFRNGKHYLMYDELQDEDGVKEITKNILKISKDQVEIQKKGFSHVNMVFEKDKKNITYYQTPYGDLLIGIYTTQIKLEETENEIYLKIEYSLDINHQHVSDCEIEVKVKERRV